MSPPEFPTSTANWQNDTYPAIDPSRPELSLAGKTVVITGGGLGIGGAIARSFAKAGAARIAIIGRRESILQEKKARIAAAYGSSIEVFITLADVSTKSEVDQAFGAISAKFGMLGVLVNNAAYFGGSAKILDDNIDGWLRSFEVNAKGTFLATKAFLAKAVSEACVLNISSGVAHLGK